MSELIGFGGYQDDASEKLKGKSGGGKFGLNQGAVMSVFAYNPNGGKDGTPGDCLDITFKLGDREYRQRIFPIDRVYGKNNTEISDKSSKEYIDGYNAEWAQVRGCVTHIMKAFVAEDALKAALANPAINSFKTWAEAQAALLPAGFQNIELDVCLQYQWKIKGDNTRTFLELPKNMKGGYWVCPTVAGVFSPVVDATGLKYVNVENVEHPFTRTAQFMESPKANEQNEGDNSATISGAPVQGAAPVATNW